MKTVKPNKLTECQKQTSGFDVAIPSEINEHEARFYHLAYVEQVHRPTLKKYDTRLTIIKMNQSNTGKEKTGGKKTGRSKIMAKKQKPYKPKTKPKK